MSAADIAGLIGVACFIGGIYVVALIAAIAAGLARIAKALEGKR